MINILIELYLTFFKIGAISFGGGYAMLPFIESEIVNRHGWIQMTEFIDIIGISQMTPGPIAINSATFVGYKVGGVIGSVCATIGVVSISCILVPIAARAMDKFKNNVYLKSALNGMKPVLIALILSAFISLAKESYIDFKSLIIGLITMVLLLVKKINPILIICISAILGFVFFFAF